MPFFLLLHMLKVGFNTLNDNCTFAFTKVLRNPFVGIVSAFTKIARSTGGNHILRYCTRTSSGNQRNEMVGGQFHIIKQTGWIAAVGASALPIKKTVAPIGFRERARQRSFLCAITHSFDTFTFGPPVSMSTVVFPALILVALMPNSFVDFDCLAAFLLILLLLNFTMRSFTAHPVVCPYDFYVVCAIDARLLQKIFSSALITPFVVFLDFIRLCRLSFGRTPFGRFRIGCIAHFRFSIFALAAYIVKSVFSAFVAMILNNRKCLLAFCATFNGDRFVDHSVSLSLNLMMSSAGGEISHFSGIGLSDDNSLYRITRRCAI